jgi:formate hydrogenlyase transcriptional activator
METSAGLASETILEILRMILAGTSLKEVLTSVARVVEAQREGMLCSVWLLDQDRIHMRAIAAPTLPPSYVAALDGFTLGPQGGSCGAAVNRREPVFVTDALTDPMLEKVRDVIIAHGFRACWSAPIISHGGEILGTFAFYFRSVRGPSPSDLQLIESATRLAAIAVERKVAEDTLRANEAKLRQDEEELRLIIDAIPQKIIVLNPDGRVIYANRVCLEYSGLSLEDVRAEGFRQRIFHPEDVRRLREERQKALAATVPFENEQRALGKDGKYRWLLVQYNPLLDRDGNIVRWYATGTDIDNRKRAEERMRNENVALREEIVRSSMFEEIIGSSEALRRVLVQVSKVAPTDSTVLIAGETGTGKELIARAIHNRSTRASRAFIRVNCAAIPPSLIASELFGHEKGSFTGAFQRRPGRFELADGGTIFLDEVGDLPPETQVALLRVLQEREFERVGGTEPLSVDVRVIAATNRDLSAAVAEGEFRQDLFYRLNVFPLQLPPLRERVADIPILVEYLIDRYARKAGKKVRKIPKRTLDLFLAYDWPGNIRELQNVVERATILSEGETFCVDESWLAPPRPVGRGLQLAPNIAEREKEMIETSLRDARGVIGGPKGAAAKLGDPRQTLESKIRKLGINRHRFRTP